MNYDQKFILFLFSCITIIVIAVTSYASFNSYLDHKNPILKTEYSDKC